MQNRLEEMEVWLRRTMACSSGRDWALNKCSSLEQAWDSLVDTITMPNHGEWLIWAWSQVNRISRGEYGPHDLGLDQKAILGYSGGLVQHVLRYPSLMFHYSDCAPYKALLEYQFTAENLSKLYENPVGQIQRQLYQTFDRQELYRDEPAYQLMLECCDAAAGVPGGFSPYLLYTKLSRYAISLGVEQLRQVSALKYYVDYLLTIPNPFKKECNDG